MIALYSLQPKRNFYFFLAQLLNCFCPTITCLACLVLITVQEESIKHFERT